MADDKRLIIAEDAGAAAALAIAQPTWVTQSAGTEVVRYQPLPHSITGTWDRRAGNRLVVPRRFRAEKFRNEIPYILGWSETGGNLGTLKRRLPTQDGQQLGMIADRISGLRFEGESGRRGDDTVERFHDYDGGSLEDILQTALKQVEYCYCNVEYIHAPYNVLRDNQVDSLGFNNGVLERARFCWAEQVPSIEYITSEATIIKWKNAAPVPAAIRGKRVGKGAGFLRPTAEIIVHWERVPAAAVALVMAKYETRYGKINEAAFTCYLHAETKTWAAQTLLFMTAKSEIRMQPHGFLEYDLSLHFNYRGDGGWNFFLYWPDGEFYEAVRDDGSAIYKTTDFETLFTTV